MADNIAANVSTVNAATVLRAVILHFTSPSLVRWHWDSLLPFEYVLYNGHQSTGKYSAMKS